MAVAGGDGVEVRRGGEKAGNKVTFAKLAPRRDLSNLFSFLLRRNDVQNQIISPVAGLRLRWLRNYSLPLPPPPSLFLCDLRNLLLFPPQSLAGPRSLRKPTNWRRRTFVQYSIYYQLSLATPPPLFLSLCTYTTTCLPPPLFGKYAKGEKPLQSPDLVYVFFWGGGRKREIRDPIAGRS